MARANRLDCATPPSTHLLARHASRLLPQTAARPVAAARPAASISPADTRQILPRPNRRPLRPGRPASLMQQDDSGEIAQKKNVPRLDRDSLPPDATDKG